MAHPKAGTPQEPVPVKYFVALLSPAQIDISPVITGLEGLFGRSDYMSDIYPFDMTDYYDEEIGGGLVRRIISFEKLSSPVDIVRYKLESRRLEEVFSEKGCRRFNIDPGYLDFYKVVLASFKVGPQKIYIGDGVYADPVLMYSQGSFSPFPWSFPDFKKGLYNKEFLKIRKVYKNNLKEL